MQIALTNDSSTSEDKIRKVEKEVLDEEYKKYELLQFNDDCAIPYLLKALGDLERQTHHPYYEKHSDRSLRRMLFQAVLGLSQCLRWIISNEGKSIDSIPDSPKWDNILMDFVTWGMEYVVWAQQFIAWSRGLTRAEIDEDRKTISFLLPDNTNYYFMIQQHEAYDQHLNSSLIKIPWEEIEKYFSAWSNQIGYRIVKPPIADAIDWKSNASSDLSNKLRQQFRETIFPELSDSVDMAGYTIGEFRNFYSKLFVNFLFIVWIERIMDLRIDQKNVYGSNPLSGTEKEIIDFFVYVTEMDGSKVKVILDDLTFDSTNFHTSLFIQPVVRSSTERLYVLPNAFTSIDPNRMLAGAYNKGIRKKRYEKLIEEIEMFHLNRVNSILSSSKWKRYLDKKFHLKNGGYNKPDFVLLDHSEKQILIIDYKHMLVPITSSEVDYRLKDIKKGLNQVRKYVNDFHHNLNEPSFSNTIDSEYKISGLLLFFAPMPIPIPATETISIIDSISLSKIMNNLSDPHLSELLDAIQKHAPIPIPESEFSMAEIKTQIQDWTFIRKIYATG